MISGNKAVLRHGSEGRALRLFIGVGGIVQYVGEFAVDGDRPWYTTDAQETRGGPVRVVIVFRLRPQAEADVAALPAPEAELPAGVQEVQIAPPNSEKACVEPDRQPYEAELREAKLVQAFKMCLKRRGIRSRA